LDLGFINIMGIKKYKPTTSGKRFKSSLDFSEITKKKPEKSLTVSKKRTSGRDGYGHVTVRGRGGGSKRKIRIVDYKRNKHNIKAEVKAIEYDPNRSSNIALLEYADTERRYIIHPKGLKPKDKVVSGENVPLEVGNSLPLRNVPSGMPIHNLELIKGQGGKAVKSAGTYCVIMGKEEKYAHVRLPSGEIRRVSLDCYATIGEVGNSEHRVVSLGKAGSSRHRGRRPTTRGVAKNPVDHPMGGGEGKASGGRHPCTPWGKITKGLKTRKKKKYSDKYIVKRRK